MLRLSVGEAVRYGSGGCSDVHHGDEPLKSVMAGLMEKVAQGHDARGLAGEVEGQRRRRASKYANNGVEFATTILKIGASNSEVGSVERGGTYKQQFVLVIPKFVCAAFRLWNGNHSGVALDCTGIDSSFGNWALR